MNTDLFSGRACAARSGVSFAGHAAQARPLNSGFTLIELLTTVAALVILLGLMVSLARDVRSRSAAALTTEILSKLERLMAEYQKQTGMLPTVASIIPEGSGGGSDQPAISELARLNNQEFLNALRGEILLNRQFNDLQPAIYDGWQINDAWGHPIVFMPHSDSSIGLSPGNHFFFFSAGPDGRYLSRDDNLYSYDAAGGGQSE